MKAVALEQDILKKLKDDDESALRYIFDVYFQELYKYSARIVNQTESAEEIVQDVILNLWNSRKTIEITTSLKAYLTTSVRNRSINYLKKKYVLLETGSGDEVMMVPHSERSDKRVLTTELNDLVKTGLSMLPAKTQLIFSLSRNSDLKHAEIATQLDLSQKSVEYHMTAALKHLRSFLSHHGYCVLLVTLS